MALSNMKVFEQYAYGSATETIQQQTEVFNGASNGAIVLEGSANEGDYSSETFWQNIAGLMRRRNAYGTGAVAGVPISQGDETTVKVAGGTPPIEFNPSQLTWIQKSPEEAGVVIGEQLGKGLVVDYLNSAIRVAVAAIGNNPDMVTDVTGAAASRAAHVTAASKFGDAASQIGVWVMHSKSMHDIYQENVANGSRLFEIGNISIAEDGFGRRYMMTDSPDLVDTVPATPVYRTLGLSSRGVVVESNGDLYSSVQESHGDENIGRTMQAEYTFNAGVKGYTWDKANGGASPNDAALATGTNWDKVATDNKNTAGVLLLSD